jgi:hypothetical protein
VFDAGAAQAAIHRQQHGVKAQVVVHVQLGSEAHLDIAHALVDIVDGQLIGAALQRLLVPNHRAGIREAPQVLLQVAVAGLEDQLVEALHRVAGQDHVAVARHLDEGGLPHGPVEVHMQVGLGEGPDEGAAIGGAESSSHAAV